MLLINFLILTIFILIYSFCAGITTVYVHQYLVSTSKMSEFSHDHRVCSFIAILWPPIWIGIIVIYYFKIIKFVFKYPWLFFTKIQKRRKQIQDNKK